MKTLQAGSFVAQELPHAVLALGDGSIHHYSNSGMWHALANA